MKELIKVILAKLGLFNLAKKLKNKMDISSDKGRNETVLQEELAFSSNALAPTAYDSLAFTIRMQIHLIEKTLVKDDCDKVNKLQLVKLLDKLQRVIDLFPDYPKDGDLIVESLGIFKTAQARIPDGAECEKLYEDFVAKNGLQNIEPHIIQIRTVGSDYVRAWDGAEEFISRRHSIRTLRTDTVDTALVREIVELAMKCPSACNRQPWKVYYTEGSEKIEKFKPNPTVTRDINNFLIVTVNKNLFASSEMLQAWINGGIFLESLVMAIHAKGLGSCLFQEIKGSKNYVNIKQIAGIPANEDIVALIGFGYLKEEYPIIETHRKDVREVLVEF